MTERERKPEAEKMTKFGSLEFQSYLYFEIELAAIVCATLNFSRATWSKKCCFYLTIYVMVGMSDRMMVFIHLYYKSAVEALTANSSAVTQPTGRRLQHSCG